MNPCLGVCMEQAPGRVRLTAPVSVTLDLVVGRCLSVPVSHRQEVLTRIRLRVSLCTSRRGVKRLSEWRNVLPEECFWISRTLFHCRLRLLRDSSDSWTVSWSPSRDRSVFLCGCQQVSMATCTSLCLLTCLPFSASDSDHQTDKQRSEGQALPRGRGV